jgi:hypothetical protein
MHWKLGESSQVTTSSSRPTRITMSEIGTLDTRSNSFYGNDHSHINFYKGWDHSTNVVGVYGTTEFNLMESGKVLIFHVTAVVAGIPERVRVDFVLPETGELRCRVKGITIKRLITTPH